MNNYQTTMSGQGLLKDNYGTTDQGIDPLYDALKRRRMRLMQTKLGVQPTMDSVDLGDVEQETAARQRGL